MAFIVIIIIIKNWYGLRHLFWNFEVQFNKKKRDGTIFNLL